MNCLEQKHSVATLFIAVLLCSTAASEDRPWTAINGHSVIGEAVKVDGNRLRIKTKQKNVSVPIDKLCKADRKWLIKNGHGQIVTATLDLTKDRQIINLSDDHLTVLALRVSSQGQDFKPQQRIAVRDRKKPIEISLPNGVWLEIYQSKDRLFICPKWTLPGVQKAVPFSFHSQQRRYNAAMRRLKSRERKLNRAIDRMAYLCSVRCPKRRDCVNPAQYSVAMMQYRSLMQEKSRLAPFLKKDCRGDYIEALAIEKFAKSIESDAAHVLDFLNKLHSSAFEYRFI